MRVFWRIRNSWGINVCVRGSLQECRDLIRRWDDVDGEHMRLLRGPYKIVRVKRWKKNSLQRAIELPTQTRDFTCTASYETVILALLKRLGGKAGISANELARAEQFHLDRRADGHKLELRVIGDT